MANKTTPLLLAIPSALFLATLQCAHGGVASKPLTKDSPKTEGAPVSKNQNPQPSAPANSDDNGRQRKTSDPLEKVNRGVFAVNKQVYRFVLHPIADATAAILRRPVLRRISYVFENVETPIRVTSNLFQGKFGRASKETAKFVLNTTVGLGGIFRPSDKFEPLANIPTEDMGQAFGKWGVPAGPYIVLPVLGPSSTRDLPGRAVDVLLSPLTWVEPPALRYSLTGGHALQENTDRMRNYDTAVEGALEEYIAVREGYLDYRAAAVIR